MESEPETHAPCEAHIVVKANTIEDVEAAINSFNQAIGNGRYIQALVSNLYSLTCTWRLPLARRPGFDSVVPHKESHNESL